MPYCIYGLATTVLAAWAASGTIDAQVGMRLPLDDSYIHLQYARQLGQGAVFEYTEGAARGVGATSLLWPLLLTPLGMALGAAHLPQAAWLLGFLALGLLAIETQRTTGLLAGPVAAWGAGLVLLACPAFSWFAASGMEVVPFAWLLLVSIRLAWQWAQRPVGTAWPLAGAVFCLPLMRPEGALLTLCLIAFVAKVRGPGWRWVTSVMASGALIPWLVCEFVTSNGLMAAASAKWLPVNPYYDSILFTVMGEHSWLLLTRLLDGRDWSALFVPTGFAWLTWLALPAVLVRAAMLRRLGVGVLLTIVGLMIFVPASYETFLVNRLRYLWPFAPAWLIGVVVLIDGAAAGAAMLWDRLRRSWLCAAGLSSVGLGLGLRLPDGMRDLHDSAEAIRSQQVSLGLWARTLPPEARLGANDVGALAFFSDHSVFDIVGLTTPGEARHWTAGAGSRFEHYEHLNMEQLPSHWLVYPDWFAIPSLLGRPLTERIHHGSILGGAVMRAHLASYQALNSANVPAPEFVAGGRHELIDRLDIADLVSEQDHAYQADTPLVGWEAKQANDVFESMGRTDGGRRARVAESFYVRLEPGAKLVARVLTDSCTELTVRAINQRWSQLTPGSNPGWHELTIAGPFADAAGRYRVELWCHSGSYTALHYWVLR